MTTAQCEYKQDLLDIIELLNYDKESHVLSDHKVIIVGVIKTLKQVVESVWKKVEG